MQSVKMHKAAVIVYNIVWRVIVPLPAFPLGRIWKDYRGTFKGEPWMNLE